MLWALTFEIFAKVITRLRPKHLRPKSPNTQLKHSIVEILLTVGTKAPSLDFEGSVVLMVCQLGPS